MGGDDDGKSVTGDKLVDRLEQSLEVVGPIDILLAMRAHQEILVGLESEALQRIGGVARLELDVDVGVALAESGEQLGQKALAGGHRGEDDDGAGERDHAVLRLDLDPIARQSGALPQRRGNGVGGGLIRAGGPLGLGGGRRQGQDPERG